MRRNESLDAGGPRHRDASGELVFRLCSTTQAAASSPINTADGAEVDSTIVVDWFGQGEIEFAGDDGMLFGHFIWKGSVYFKTAF